MKAYQNMLRKKAAGFTLIEIMIVVLIIGILLAIAIPNFITARSSGRAKACIANLRQIDSGKQQYIMDNKLASSYAFGGDTNTAMPDLVPTYVRSLPSCPAGGTYTVGAGTAAPTCSYGTTDGTQFNHALPYT